MIRLFAIAVTGLGMFMLSLAIFGLWFPRLLPGSVAVPLCIISLIAGTWLGIQLFGKKRSNPIEELEEKGLAEVEEFRALRSFEVDEFEDEGLHFFLELEGGGVLFLCGQYLYDYQEITDDDELNQNATFPCAHFRIKRHKVERWVYEVEPLSPYIPPEEKLPHYCKAYIKKHGFPEDGTVYAQSYEELKAEIRG